MYEREFSLWESSRISIQNPWRIFNVLRHFTALAGNIKYLIPNFDEFAIILVVVLELYVQY